MIKAWHNVGYRFFDVLEVARWLLDYLGPQKDRGGLPDRPPLAGAMNIDLAKSLLGVTTRLSKKTGKPVMRLAGKDIQRCHRRIRSAGVDPESFEVVDLAAASWFWHQVCSHKGHYYSEKEQFRLMGSGETPPNINTPLKFNYRTNEEQARTWRLDPTQERFKGTIREHLENHLDGYRTHEQREQMGHGLPYDPERKNAADRAPTIFSRVP
jgi:hypothetical protein